MRLSITVDNQEWLFELLETSGKALPTKTQGGSLYFECHLTVALHNQTSDMSYLYRLLKTLTANYWHGMAIHHEQSNEAELTSYSLRLPKEDERGIYICELGYKAYMPQKTIEEYIFKVKKD